MARLPGVDGAVTSAEGVALGVLEGVQDGLVLGAEVHAARNGKHFKYYLQLKSVKKYIFLDHVQLVQVKNGLT